MTLRKGFATLILAAALGGCAGGPGVDDSDEINAYIRDLGTLPVEEPKVVEGEKSAPTREGDYSCTLQDYSETRRYDEIVAYAANSESMWPGAILRGDSVYSGLFTQTVFERKPLSVSVSLENLTGSPVGTMDAPSLSSFRETISKIMSAEVRGDTPANIFSEIEEVHSQEQLSLAMGAGVSAGGAPFSIKASFNFDDQNVRSRYLVKYVQAYYTVDVDQPSSPRAFLADSVTLDEVSDKFGPDNPPVYVSSVTYGRTVLFTFESQFSSTELGSALEFVYSGGIDVSGNVSVTYKEMLSQSKITAYILGGSGGDAAQAIDGYEALKEFLRSGGNYSSESPGAPIAYKLSYLSDNAPARLSFAQNYQVKDCVRVAQKILVTVNSMTVEAAGDEVGSGGDLEIYGKISASSDGNSTTLWNKNSDAWIQIAENQTYPVGSEPLAEGILDVSPQAGSSLRLTLELYESDTFGNDTFPVVNQDRPFEIGWRDTVDVVASMGGARVRVSITLQPI